jgi:hypothetical protein
MQNNARKFRVVFVVVGLPILRDHVDLDVTGTRFFLAKLDNGAAEIRTGPAIPETGMKHTNGLSIDGAEIVAAEALVMPDVLEEPFRWVRRIALAQERSGFLLRAPLIVKVRPESGHGSRFQSGGGKCQEWNDPARGRGFGFQRFRLA